MNIQKAKKDIESLLPGSEVISMSHDKGLYLEIAYPIEPFISKYNSERMAKEKRLNSLDDAIRKVFGDDLGFYSTKVFESKTASDRAIIYKTVQSILGRANEFRMYYSEVGVSINKDGTSVSIDIVNPAANRVDSRAIVDSKIREEVSKIQQLSCVQRVNINISVGASMYDGLSFFNGDYDDDDYDERSPNWPSKTGNPSGGGRDNNPT